MHVVFNRNFSCFNDISTIHIYKVVTFCNMSHSAMDEFKSSMCGFVAEVAIRLAFTKSFGVQNHSADASTPRIFRHFRDGRPFEDAIESAVDDFVEHNEAFLSREDHDDEDLIRVLCENFFPTLEYADRKSRAMDVSLVMFRDIVDQYKMRCEDER